MKIWKTQLHVTAQQSVLVPQGTEFVSVGAQNDSPVAWFACDPDANLVRRQIFMVATGRDIPGSNEQLHFIGTITLSGHVVLHVFEEKKRT